MPLYGSVEEARRAFETYVRLEPRLAVLWERCLHAAPLRRVLDDADVEDQDPYELDQVSETDPDEGWCAEDYFLDHVKSDLLLLAGLYRPGPQHELHESEAFEEIYDLLLNWALRRTCACCATTGGGVDRPDVRA